MPLRCASVSAESPTYSRVLPTGRVTHSLVGSALSLPSCRITGKCPSWRLHRQVARVPLSVSASAVSPQLRRNRHLRLWLLSCIEQRRGWTKRGQTKKISSLALGIAPVCLRKGRPRKGKSANPVQPRIASAPISLRTQGLYRIHSRSPFRRYPNCNQSHAAQENRHGNKYGRILTLHSEQKARYQVGESQSRTRSTDCSSKRQTHSLPHHHISDFFGDPHRGPF